MEVFIHMCFGLLIVLGTLGAVFLVTGLIYELIEDFRTKRYKKF